MVPDVAQIVNIGLLLLMFVSPIGFSVDHGPARACGLLVYLNPMTYLMEAFRFALLGIRTLPIWFDFAFLAVRAGWRGRRGTFFRRMSPVFSDYE